MKNNFLIYVWREGSGWVQAPCLGFERAEDAHLAASEFGATTLVLHKDCAQFVIEFSKTINGLIPEMEAMYEGSDK